MILHKAPCGCLSNHARPLVFGVRPGQRERDIKSKEEVFQAVMEKLTEQFSERLITIIRDSSLTIRSRLEKIVEAMRNVCGGR